MIIPAAKCKPCTDCCGLFKRVLSLIHQFILCGCNEKLIAVAIIDSGYLRPQSTTSVFTRWKSAVLAPHRGQTHRTNTLRYSEPLCAGAALVDRGAQDSVSCAYLPRRRQIAKPAFVSDNPRWSPASPTALVHRGSRCFVLRSFPTGITSEWQTGISFPSSPPPQLSPHPQCSHPG